jgi:hypothetical protein
MRNFAGKNRPDKKVWGVLGKQETFYSPEQFQDKGRIIPLNANPLEAWDSTRSRYIRRPQMPPLANDGQQAGVVPQETSGPVPSPTPTLTNTATPTNTQTSTPTPSITPSSTPYPLPIQPVLWYDSTNLGSIDYISSGGTNYISAWRSLGTIQKTLSGDSVNTMPIWSGSSQLPGSPLIVRFDKNTNTALQDYLTQRFDSTPIPYSGLTVFQVFAKPNGLTYQDTSATLGFGYPFVLVSGNTTNGGFTSGTTPIFLVNISVNQPAVGANTILNQKREFAYANNTIITNFSAATINSKFLYHVAIPYPTGSMYFEINQSGGTNTISPITASTPNTSFNQVYLGRQQSTSGGTYSTTNNSGAELGEIMVFNRELTIQEQEQVQNYLRDKWRYDEWASPVPTPTPTYTPTQTTTPTNTTTTTPTPSPTPPFNPSSISELRTWYDANDATTITKRTGTDFIEIWNDKSGNGYNLTQTTASSQPLYTGGTSVSSWSGNSYIYFDDGDYLSRTTGTSFSDSGFTYFYVARVDNNELDGLVFNYTDQAPPVNVGKYRAYQSGSGLSRILVNGGDDYLLRYDWTTPSTIGGKNTYQYGWVSGTTLGSLSGSVNNLVDVVIESAGTIPDVVTAISVGSNNDGAAPIIGYVAEIIVYGKVLTTTEKDNVETYLKNKWGYNTW